MSSNGHGGLSNSSEDNAVKRRSLVEWLNSLSPDLKLPVTVTASEEELRARLLDGTVLCGILNRMNGIPFENRIGAFLSSEQKKDNLKRFLAAVGEMGLPRFDVSDFEQGSMSAVVECLLCVRNRLNYGQPRKMSDIQESSSSDASQGSPNAMGLRGERRRPLSEAKLQQVIRGPLTSEQSTALSHHLGHKFHEVFQLKQGGYSDLPAAKISEMMKSNSLDNAPTQSLLSVVNGILDESIERKNGEIPHRVACLLRKVVQEIERRISTQTEHIRNQNNLIKAREEKYQSRIRVLETLATGTSEETQIATNRLQKIKIETGKVEEKKKIDEQDTDRLMKEKENNDFMLSDLKQELEIKNKTYAQCCEKLESEAKDRDRLMKEKENNDFMLSNLKQELEIKNKTYAQCCEKLESEAKDRDRLMKEKENNDFMLSNLKQELEIKTKTYAQCCEKLESEAKETKTRLEEKIKEVEFLLAESQKKTKVLEECSESKSQNWNKKAHIFQSFIDCQLESVQDLRMAYESIKKQVVNTQKKWWEEINSLGLKLKELVYAAENYHTVLAENRKLYNEVLELKGNIRVCCRIRPFLPGENRKVTIINYIGEDGDLIVENPSKAGKDGHKMFKFNKVFGPSASQEEVYMNIQPLIRSVLDGYNVCIFAYGQTGSGKTYTMNGPPSPTKENWGVNYRALNDLFCISRNRKCSFTYEVGVQMVEIYNEQVRDLLSNGSSQKRLGIVNTSQPNGLAVPDASMQPVKSTADVLQLMQFGETNRAMSSTSLNERSSRSHSILTVHVQGVDLKTGSTSRGCLHLIDLAGSERVDRSEVTGDRLKEAQHINKSLSALGDVIFALAQKSSHVPYRNSKLTQVLQTSLGGRAKTLMFVQIRSSTDSYSETLSTLKFAERVSGVELGVAKNNKEGKDVRDLMEQVASLKDTIARKDGEIEQLQQFNDIDSPRAKSESLRIKSLKHSSSSPGLQNETSKHGQRFLSGRVVKATEKSASDPDNSSKISEKYSDTGSQQSMDDVKSHKETSHKIELEKGDTGSIVPSETKLLGFGEADSEERLSDISDDGLSVGTATDGSGSVVDLTLLSEGSKTSESTTDKTGKVQAERSKILSQKGESSTLRSKLKDPLKSSSLKRTTNFQTAAESNRLPKS